MAGVTGPIGTLPGTQHVPPTGMVCDVCKTALANVRIQGETDSMGSEMADYCIACLGQAEEADVDSGISNCERCGAVERLRPIRDIEEGTTGPIYWYCTPCHERFTKEMRDDWCTEDEDDYDYYDEEES